MWRLLIILKLTLICYIVNAKSIGWGSQVNIKFERKSIFINKRIFYYDKYLVKSLNAKKASYISFLKLRSTSIDSHFLSH